MKARIADVAAYGCTALLGAGVVALLAATITGWAAAPRQDLRTFLHWTRLLIVGSLVFGALLHVTSSRLTAGELRDLLRRTWDAGLHPGNLVRAYLLTVVVMLLGAATVALTPLRLPYVFYTVLRIATCLAWATILGIVLKRRIDHDGEIAYLSVAFLVTFTPIWPLHLARGTWAIVDAIAAVALLVVVAALSRYPTRTQASGTTT